MAGLRYDALPSDHWPMPLAGNPMSSFFAGDDHLGHAGARNLCRRPFPSVAEMDRQMIVRWNFAFEPAYEVWHLRDFANRQASDHRSTDVAVSPR